MDEIFKEHGIALSAESLSKLEQYTKLLISGNEKMNLTAITEPDEIIIKHYLDSLMLLKFEDIGGKSLIDIGTGAGIPGLILKIAETTIYATLMDSLNKRVKFLDETIQALELKNVKAVHSRAEDGAKDPKLREGFDYATSRAVSRLNILCEYALPYVKIGGIFAAYKGAEIENELAEAGKAIAILGGEIERVEKFAIKDQSRAIIFVRKLRASPPAYPRKSNVIAKRPII